MLELIADCMKTCPGCTEHILLSRCTTRRILSVVSNRLSDFHFTYEGENEEGVYLHIEQEKRRSNRKQSLETLE